MIDLDFGFTHSHTLTLFYGDSRNFTGEKKGKRIHREKREERKEREKGRENVMKQYTVDVRGKR